MEGFAKAIFMSIVVTVVIYVLTSFIYFFPWYTTLIVETFNISQIVAGDNYLKETYYDETLDRLKDKPIFKDYPFVSHNENGLSVSEELFNTGLCLPSDSNMTEEEQQRVINIIKTLFK